MKALQLLVNSKLPEDLRDYSRTYDTKSVGTLMAEAARRYPEHYEAIAQHLSDTGRNASYQQGETLTLSDMRPVLNRDAVLAQMDAEIARALHAAPSREAFKQAREAIWGRYSHLLEKETQKAALQRGNNLAYSVVSGARGKPAQLKMMLTTPGLYEDSKGRSVPLFIRHSFGEGLRPAEYLAGTFGARSSVLSTKRATAKGGDLCLHEDTLVRMADFSVKRIADIALGDLVLGADKQGNTFPVKVTCLFDQGSRPVYAWEFQDLATRKTLTEKSTETHNFLFERISHCVKQEILEVKPIGKSSKRSRLYFAQSFQDTGLREEPFALLVGIMLGDGSCGNYRPKNRLHLTCADPTQIADTLDYLASLGLRYAPHKTNAIQYRISIADSTALRNPGRFKHPLKAVLHRLGLLDADCYSKFVPTEVATWSNKSVADLIRGYTATDGSLTQRRSDGNLYPEVIYTSVSKTLLEGIRRLLQWRFGIYGTEVHQVSADKRTKGIGEVRADSFQFSVGSAKGLKKLLNLLLNTPGVKSAKAKRYLQELGSKNIKRDGSRVTRGKFLGNLPCWDIEVAHPDHLFVLASGVICSNSKQMTQTALHLVVNAKDCGTRNGIDLSLDDPSVRHRVLARAVAGVPAGTILDRMAMAHLRKAKVDKVLVRSALTCQSDHGLCSKCVGAGPTGKLPAIGDSIGVTASQAIGEPITQMALNSKHVGGVAGQKREYSGFQVINQIVQSPETFPDRAAVAEHDGTVESITDAPQGGSFVRVAGQDHYVPSGYPVLVKPGDKVEAGDQLSDGLVDAGDIVRLRGLGEGRRYYADRLKKVLDDSGMQADRRNTEVLARAAIDHVRVEDPEGLGDALPDDVVSYNRLAARYRPPEDVRETEPRHSVGKFLQAPALHYSIGTRITPRISKHLTDSGFVTVATSTTAPGFTPEMVRLRTASHVNPDWLASQHTSFLTKQLGEAAIRGEDTNIAHNNHFAPRLAVGADFAKNIETTGEF